MFSKLTALSDLLVLSVLLLQFVSLSQAWSWGTSPEELDSTSSASQSPPSSSLGAPSKRLDYKLTVKKPYLYNGSIPFWTMGGDIIRIDDFIRLTPSVPGSRGWIWADRPNTYAEWQAELTFRISGNHMHGGRGLAFWYTKTPMGDGPIFGAKDQWDGLGIWLDSANPRTHTPTTVAILNDGSLQFASRLNPEQYLLGSCSINYRNTNNVPAHLRVTYRAKTLTIMLDPMGDGKDFRTCIQQTVNLPTGYYFGVSAAAHTPADDHDLISFETWELNPPAKTEHKTRPLEEEKRSQGEEFKGLDEEQKKKIEETEFHVRQMREASQGDEVRGEAVATLASIFDTQKRILEDLQVMQMQIEALGAPTPEDLIVGNYRKKQADDGKEPEHVTAVRNDAVYVLARGEKAHMRVGGN
ncbi:legume-like lectin family-domain-containing protein [Dichotomocladium elegans]|nr:legume-like lectin family-domain-containing protein [Dichotomocladium elegans]